jgi:uncharacterized membrane protein YqjE
MANSCICFTTLLVLAVSLLVIMLDDDVHRLVESCSRALFC